MTAHGLTPETLLAAIRGANLEPCQLSARSTPSKLARLSLQRVCLDFAALGPAFHFTGQMAANCYTLVFVLACPDKGRSFNFAVEHTDGYMGFFPPGGVVDAVTPEGYTNATLTVPASDFHTAVERHFPEIPNNILNSGAGLLIGAYEQEELRRLLGRIEHDLWHNPESLASTPVRRQIERELLAAFFAALRSGCSNIVPAASIRAAGRMRQLRQARDYLNANAHKPVYLDDLCSALSLSARSVENLFQDLLGTSPTTYLRHLRLHGARRTLLNAESSHGVVKSAALNWGFLHHGHFARYYRQVFGESPIETISHRR